jgi:hypothetical protein
VQCLVEIRVAEVGQKFSFKRARQTAAELYGAAAFLWLVEPGTGVME